MEEQITFNLIFSLLKDPKTKTLVCFDSSKSMNNILDLDDDDEHMEIQKGKLTSLEVAKLATLCCSRSLKGPFKNGFLTFNSGLQHWSDAYDFFRNTNLPEDNDINIYEIANRLSELKNKGYKESDFPKRILCISDGTFSYRKAYTKAGNPNEWFNDNISEYFLFFLQILLENGFSENYVKNLELILWDIPNNENYGGKYAKFYHYGHTPNVKFLNKFDIDGLQYLIN